MEYQIRPLKKMITERSLKAGRVYFEAVKPRIKRSGRPRKYGEKVKILELFDHLHLFSKVKCTILCFWGQSVLDYDAFCVY